MKKIIIIISVLFSISLTITFFLKKIVVVDSVDDSSLSITRCYTFSNSNCSFDYFKKAKIIKNDFFFKTLEFSLLTPGDYSVDMVENIQSYKKDATELTQERLRKIKQLEIHLNLIDHLESQKSTALSVATEKDLLDAIASLNQRIHLFIDKAKRSSRIHFVFVDNGLEKLFYQISEHLLGSEIPLIRFTSIPSGTFLMGESLKYNDTNEVKNHVSLSKGFELAIFETSQLEWYSIMGYNPSFFSQKNYCPNNFLILDDTELCPNHPIETVSFEEVNLFISRLNSLDLNYSYRLPTEAEWEYASRGNNQATYFFGEDDSKLGDYAWFYENSSLQTHERGLKKPNQFGLFDILGNVFEWTSDYYSELTSKDRLDPSVDEISQWKVTKGGSWYARARGLRPAFRCKDEKKFRYSRIGFRLLRTPKKH